MTHRIFVARAVLAGLMAFGLDCAHAQAGISGARWATYQDKFGTEVHYPRELFSVAAGPTPVGTGQSFTTKDGRARLSIYAQPNTERHTPASYLRQYFRGSRRALHYDRVAPSFFAVSMNRSETILYRRCNFSQQGQSSIHCIDLSYPSSQKTAWDQTVTRISRSLRAAATNEVTLRAPR
jgi:hypothetical protein